MSSYMIFQSGKYQCTTCSNNCPVKIGRLKSTQNAVMIIRIICNFAKPDEKNINNLMFLEALITMRVPSSRFGQKFTSRNRTHKEGRTQRIHRS